MGTTSFGEHDRRAPPISPSEERARRVRCGMLDNPFHFRRHDKHAPPISPSEGRACRVRRSTLDRQSRLHGHDKHAPPSEHDKRAPPTLEVRHSPFARPTNLTQLGQSHLTYHLCH